MLKCLVTPDVKNWLYRFVPDTGLSIVEGRAGFSEAWC